MLQSVGVIIMLFSIFYDVFKPKWVLFDLWRIFLSVPIHLFANADIAIIFRLAINELKIFRRKILRQVNLCRFESDKRLFSG